MSKKVTQDEIDAQDRITAATGYDELLVPALFEEWTDPVLDAAEVGPGDRVLDVACGTGVLARAALRRVGFEGAVTGIDPSRGMLHVAASRAPAAGWRKGTAEALPYADALFDVVVSQFGLMFFDKKEKALREMMRVLAPGGRMAIAVWDSLDNIPAYATEVELLERLAGAAAANALRAPFVLGDTAELAALFERSGLPPVTITTHVGTGRFPSVRAMVEADLRGWLPVMGVELTEDLIEEILAEAETALAEFVTTDGEVVFANPAHIVATTKPGGPAEEPPVA